MTDIIPLKDGIKRAVDITRLTLKAMDEDLSLLKAYAEEANDRAGRHRSHTPSEHYPVVYTAKFSNGSDEETQAAFIRMQEDAPFVCTGIALLSRNNVVVESASPTIPFLQGLRLTDESSGRVITHHHTDNVLVGTTVFPLVGFIPMSVFKSSMDSDVFYLGQNFYYEMPVETAFPRNGIVKAEAFGYSALIEIYVSLIGYKVFGG